MIRCQDIRSVCAGLKDPKELQGDGLCRHLDECQACGRLVEALDDYGVAVTLARHIWNAGARAVVVSEAVIRLA